MRPMNPKPIAITPIQWRCQATKTVRHMDSVVSVCCHKHFRHGVRRGGYFSCTHAAYFPDDPTVRPLRWRGIGVGSKEQEEAWEVGTQYGMTFLDISTLMPAEVIAKVSKYRMEEGLA